MNRRTFLATSLLALAAPRAALATPPIQLSWVATRVFAVTDPGPDDPTEVVVRVERRTDPWPPLPDDPDELVQLGHFTYLGAMTGEYYVAPAEALAAPAELALPAVFATFTSSAGVAAYRQAHALGMMQRERFRWTIQASGEADTQPAPVVTALALLLADREIEDTTESVDADGHHTGGLWDLLPDVADLPFPAEVTEERADAATPVATPT